MLVGPGGGHDRDLHAAQLVDLVVLDLREDELIPEAERVVAAAIKGVGGDTRGNRAPGAERCSAGDPGRPTCARRAG